MLTRRSLLAALSLAPLTALPVAAAPDTIPEGIMRMTFEGREITVDTNEVPAVWQVQDEEIPRIKMWVSQPDERDLYLIIGRHGTLEVSALCATDTTWLPHDPKRTGSVEWTETGRYTTKYRQTVRVIGKVIGAPTTHS